MKKILALGFMLFMSQFTMADSMLQNTGTGLTDCDRNIKSAVLASNGYFGEAPRFVIESFPKDTKLTYDNHGSVKTTRVKARFFDGTSRTGEVRMEVTLSNCLIKSLTFND